LADDEQTSDDEKKTKKRPPRIKLLNADTPEHIDQIVAGLQQRDVWRNLDMPGPMERPGKVRAQFVSGRYDGHLIVDAETEEIYGFFLLHVGKLKSQGIVEVDIAIPSRELRGMGLSKHAFVHLFDHWLGGGKCAEMWGWIDVGNRSSVEMIKTLEIPIINETSRTISVDGPVDIIEVKMTAENWERTRPRLLERWA
jgi:hypothetical protein